MNKDGTWNKKRFGLQLFLPLLVLSGGAWFAWHIINSGEKPKTKKTSRPVTLVRVLRVKAATYTLRVASQGTVRPRTQSTLVSQLKGKITTVAQAWAPGAFFEQGEVLLSIEKGEYEFALARAKAEYARAKRVLALAEQAASIARDEWKRMMKGEPDPLVVHEPQLTEARANVEAALASVAQAKRDLARTSIKAPYGGRVSKKFVDLGQYIQPGTPLALIHAIDRAEVRLPLHDSELAHLNLPLSLRKTGARFDGPRVRFTAEFAGKKRVWNGRIVRVEGEIDAKTRMVYLVAEVQDPYNLRNYPGHSNLPIGLFVQAEISGKQIAGLFEIPREALRGKDQVLIVDDNDRIHRRKVSVRKKDAVRVLIDQGLADGDRVCLTRLEVATEGMQVRSVEKQGR